ncbi:Gamma-D-glutamyl-L-lysine endopeptidase [Acetivibrio saccincola]|uniref:Gamma-D-glutamyl-L-lysine endopeptidase n=2 Tax=Acetivibrio saccincola TaxID=1677857 RepID=A0A2K9DWZ2_9FIRM|nr:Gamma-D-glutamyl-L-lysine endopeptidase [Acetivibrio saccincola]
MRVSWMKEIKGELKFNGQILRMVLVVGMVGVRKKVILIISVLLISFLFVSCAKKPDTGETLIEIDEAYYKDKAVVISTVADIFKETDFTSQRLTQALFNQEVTVLGSEGGWSKVKVSDGHIGWIRTKSIDENCRSIMKELYQDRVVVTGKTKKILDKPEGRVTVKDVVMGTELYILSVKDNYYEVALPKNTTGWIERKDTIVVPAKEPIPKTSGKDLAATVKKYLNTPYLSGGISTWEGIDSAGLLYICCKINGFEFIKEDFFDYHNFKGKDINIEDIEPGDLVFLNNGKDLEKVFDVGIYTGENQFIYVSKSAGVVADSIQSEKFQNNLIGIKRVFDSVDSGSASEQPFN